MEELLGKLRRKEGNWVEWGQWCQELQKAGMTTQAIFEQTGFEPIHQNQLIVASQVYHTIANSVAPAVLEFFTHRGSDILYELRVLPQSDRVAAAELVVQMGLNSEETRQVAKAVKDFSLLSSPPPHFTSHPGDAVAYQVWKTISSTSGATDANQRAQLISRGLRFAHSTSARQQIEQLLASAIDRQPVSIARLPLYRLEAEEQLPRVFPVAGKLPLRLADWTAIPSITTTEPFGMVVQEGVKAWIPLPGWKVVKDIEDGAIVLADTHTLLTYSGQEIASSFPDRPEEILLLIDRAQRQWDKDGFFFVAEAEELYLKNFPSPPAVELWGRLMLVLRQPRVLEDATADDPWTWEE
ncbi:MAG: RuBisCO accumulation factor 1 [Pseudanabaenaceae cyanobacterium]